VIVDVSLDYYRSVASTEGASGKPGTPFLNFFTK